MATILDRVGDVMKKHGSSGEAYLGLLGRAKKALETSRLVRVSVDEIDRYPDQPRKFFDGALIQSLSTSIAEGGQIQAGMIRTFVKPPIKYQIVDGERRWLAVKAIPSEKRPSYKAELIDADNEVVQFLIAGMANFNRAGHQPLEITDTIERFKKFGIPLSVSAELLGITPSWAEGIYGLRNLAEQVKEMIRPLRSDGTRKKKDEMLQITAAMQIAKLPKQDRQIDLALKVMRGDISLDRLRASVISAGHEAGTPVRVAERSATKLWTERDTKVNGTAKTIEKLHAYITHPTMLPIIKGHPMEAQALLKKLESAQKRLVETVEAVRNQVYTIK